MAETTLQIIAGCKLLCACGFALLYGLGGMVHKALRRYAGPLWILGGVILFGLWEGTFKPWFIAYPLILCGVLHLGYGVKDNDTAKKIIRRTIYGLSVGCASIPLLFPFYNWGLFLLHIGVCITFSCVLGVWNITKVARNEETSLGFVYAFLPMFMI